MKKSAESKPKTCREIEADFTTSWHNLYTQRTIALNEAVVREFPIGTKVWFKIGVKRIEGEVMEHQRFYPEEIIVRNPKTKKRHTIKCYHLEHRD